MTAYTLDPSLLAVLNGNIFGYLLHAIELVFAQVLFCFHLKRRNHFVLRFLLALCIMLSGSLGFGLFFERYFPYFRYLIAFVFSLLALPICCDVTVWEELFYCAAAVASQNLSYSVSGIIVGAFGWNPVEVSLVSAIIQTILYIIVQAGTFLICVRRLKHMDSGFSQERLPMILISLTMAVIIYLVQYDRQSLYAADFFLWRFMFISNDIISLYMLFAMYDRIKLRKENLMLDQLRASEERKYEFDKRAIEMVNIKCHDLKHQLIELRSMVGEEQAQVIKGVEDAVMIYDSVTKTGCKPLDVILTNKYLLCEKYGIRFSYMVDGEKLSIMSSVDIYSLFGNALDNAIRAVKDVEDSSKRVINMTVVAREKLLFIHIENYTETAPVIRDGLSVTTQSDTDQHGFGMISMKRIAERYSGVMDVSYIRNMFNLDITIPFKDEPLKKNA